MNLTNSIKGTLSESDGVFTLKNENTTLGFVRFNNKGEIEYIFVNPLFRNKKLAIRLLKLVGLLVKKNIGEGTILSLQY